MMVDVFTMMVNLHMGVMEVGDLFEDAFILDVAVEWVTMRPLVWVDSIGTIVYEVIVCMEICNCSVSCTISNTDEEIKFHAVVVTLGQEETIWQASGAFIVMKIQITST